MELLSCHRRWFMVLSALSNNGAASSRARTGHSHTDPVLHSPPLPPPPIPLPATLVDLLPRRPPAHSIPSYFQPVLDGWEVKCGIPGWGRR